MAKVKVTLTVAIDTDTFSPETWRTFIKQNVPPIVFTRIMRSANDFFPLEKLKALAIKHYEANQEFCRDFGLEE